MDELLEKKMLLEILEEAMPSLIPEEHELADKVFGVGMSVYEFFQVYIVLPCQVESNKNCSI